MSTLIEWEVLNPTAEYEKVCYIHAPGITTLEGKRIGMLWNNKPDGDIFLDSFGELLQERFKDIGLTKFYAPDVIWSEDTSSKVENVDAVIAGVGD